jgi:hypothetical protein
MKEMEITITVIQHLIATRLAKVKIQGRLRMVEALRPCG